MRKRTKKILIIIGIVLFFALIALKIIDEIYGLFVHIESNPDRWKITEAVEPAYKELYADKWTFGGGAISDEEHTPMFDSRYWQNEINMGFELKENYDFDDKNLIKNISEICKTLVPVVRECVGDKYSSYPIRFDFVRPNLGEYIIVICTGNYDMIEIRINASGIQLKDIAKWFPEVNNLDAQPVSYDSIEEIQGIKDLQSLDLGRDISLEEKKYILSLYPDCIIYNRGTELDCSKIGKAVTVYRELYGERWTFDGGTVFEDEYIPPMFGNGGNHKKDTIEIWFGLKEGYQLDDADLIENMAEICRTFVPVVRECLEGEYDSYPIWVHFERSCGGCISVICTGDFDSVTMWVNNRNIQLKDIARYFPEINKLKIDDIAYDSIEELQGIHDLQCFDIRERLSAEEKEYILSRYPDCKIYYCGEEQ